MNPQRIIVLGFALVAAGGAAFLVRGMLGGGTPTVQAKAAPTIAMGEVLVASSNLSPGQALSDDLKNAEPISDLSRWVQHYLRQNPEGPAGLYFGTAGAAWFLLSAAEFLQDAELRETSLSIVSGLPSQPPLSDITHGAAGIGLTLLHFFHQTGDPQFLSKALRLAEYLRSDFCISNSAGLTWSRVRISSSGADPKDVSYGFAHGVAGIGYFFLSLYLSLINRPSDVSFGADIDTYLGVAIQSGDTLLSSSVEVDSALYWPHGPSRPTLWPHWCNGSSGVGAFLIRLAIVTGNTRLEQVAIKAAQAVLRERWGSGVSQCHGLSGNGEYLLDLFQFTGQQRFLQGALHLGSLIELHKIIRPSGITFPDDTGMPTGLDLSIGAAGVAAFLSRLAGHQTRLLMLDYLIPPSSYQEAVGASAWSLEHGLVISR